MNLLPDFLHCTSERRQGSRGKPNTVNATVRNTVQAHPPRMSALRIKALEVKT